MNKCYLTIAGKKYEARLGIGFMERAIKEEKPEDSNIMNIPAIPLMAHSISYGFERRGEPSTLTKYDIHDWIDEVGLQDESVTKAKDSFMRAFLESMKTHMPDAEKDIDAALKSLEQKKKVSKSGKKNGKKTS